VQIPDDYLPRILTALEHYAAYMKATNRDERFYLEVADFLKKKGQGKEQPTRMARKKEGMTLEERRVRPEHHVVHDYANLVASRLVRTDPKYAALIQAIPTANSHVWHAFYQNCRKMFEFFTYKEHSDYFRACDFIQQDRLPYTFQHWTNARVQHHMEGHMVHVGRDRLTNKIGNDDDLYQADFENAWRSMMENLKPQHKDVFRDEIDFRLTDPEFTWCGTLGKEFIL